MNDVWLPRLHLMAQMVLLVVCGLLIGFGHNSSVTDLFCAGAGGLLATTSYSVITQGKAPPSSD